jgi:hypothetical protein
VYRRGCPKGRATGIPAPFYAVPDDRRAREVTGGAAATHHPNPVPESRAGKNRLHLDVFVDEPESWIAHGEALGATRLWRNEDPADWYQVLADPEGIEFCICANPQVAGQPG